MARSAISSKSYGAERLLKPDYGKGKTSKIGEENAEEKKKQSKTPPVPGGRTNQNAKPQKNTKYQGNKQTQ